MIIRFNEEDLFCEYFESWVDTYKKGAIANVTLAKYRMSIKHVIRIAGGLRLKDITRTTYQQLLNNFASNHEKQTTMDFHHQIKGAVLDAVDEGLIERDPTRKVIIKGVDPREKKKKYLNEYELQSLIRILDLKDEINWDWFILLIAKTGMRFSEALALTPLDFDFPNQTINIDKTWDYKSNTGFLPTKNKSSVRKIHIDWQTTSQFSQLVKDKSQDSPIFVEGVIYNSTLNGIINRHCNSIGIPAITIHGLRHTHASLLLFSGVSIASVARRLGHSSISTTQNTYINIINEMNNQDLDIIIKSLSKLNF